VLRGWAEQTRGRGTPFSPVLQTNPSSKPTSTTTVPNIDKRSRLALRASSQVLRLDDGELLITSGERRARLSDHDGRRLALLELLDGRVDLATIARRLGISAADAVRAATQLNTLRMLEDATVAPPPQLHSGELERYGSQIRMLSDLESADANRFELQAALSRARVLVSGPTEVVRWSALSLAGIGVSELMLATPAVDDALLWGIRHHRPDLQITRVAASPQPLLYALQAADVALEIVGANGRSILQTLPDTVVSARRSWILVAPSPNACKAACAGIPSQLRTLVSPIVSPLGRFASQTPPDAAQAMAIAGFAAMAVLKRIVAEADGTDRSRPQHATPAE
jgi:hypothetical protein